MIIYQTFINYPIKVPELFKINFLAFNGHICGTYQFIDKLHIKIHINILITAVFMRQESVSRRNIIFPGITCLKDNMLFFIWIWKEFGITCCKRQGKSFIELCCNKPASYTWIISPYLRKISSQGKQGWETCVLSSSSSSSSS